MNTLWIIRGHSGSGKSTYARSLGLEFHFEADQYFMDDKGTYNYNVEEINEAHQWCFNNVEAAMKTQQDVVVCNTFIQKRHIRRYFDLALDHGYKVNIRRCIGDFPNVHGVPEEKVKHQKKIYQPLSSEKTVALNERQQHQACRG
ncbi:AAA family ATPase [Endozoicomonas ascidiicola]|uniref:AAA family ATPase n=1 Tax=Endozoicomonas ascidiicola TaxID=1698521 RepID=UPI00083513E1|nr:AAA family ATPase [Endozoicomonas ascidiicola]